MVLVATRNPLNLGAAARAMSNFGFPHLCVVNPYEIAFREARSAVGAEKILSRAREFSSLADAVADCTLVVGTTAARNRLLQHPLRRLEQGAKLIRNRLVSGPVALLFGSEKVGLSKADFSLCHWLMRIPTCEANLSMNLGQAVAVCLYELVRQGKPRSASTESPADSGQLERITVMLLDALRASGYLTPDARVAGEEKLRRMVRRLRLTAQDAEVWQGMVRQILWKLRAG